MGHGERLAQHMFPAACLRQLSQFGGFCFSLHYDDAGCKFTSNHGNRFMPDGKMPEPQGNYPSVLATRHTAPGCGDRLSACVHLHTDLRRPMYEVGLLNDMALLQYDKTGESLHVLLVTWRRGKRGGLHSSHHNWSPLCLLLYSCASRSFLKLSNSRHIQAYGLKVLAFCPGDPE